MAIKFNRSQTFATNGTVDAPSLHNLVDGLNIYQSLITDQTNVTSVSTADELLIALAAGSSGDAPKAVTVQELFQDALTAGTYTDLNLSGNITASTATIGTAVVSTATISTATITSGTYSGRVNSTLGTISNFTTTLAGDFTISQGTGTLGTSGVTSGTYGATTTIPIITVDSKGRITTMSTALAQAGATGGGTDRIFYENDTNVTTTYTISTNKNAMSAGPITIDDGVIVTVQDGSVWTVV